MKDSNNTLNKQTKRKLPLIIAIIVAIALLALGAICIYLFTPIFKTPKQKLALAAAKTFYEEPSSLYDSEGLLFLTLVADGAFSYEAECALDNLVITDDILGLYEDKLYKHAAGITLSGNGSIDINNRKSFMESCFRYNGIRLVSPEIFIDDNDIYLSDAHLFDSNIYINSETFGKDFASSEIIYNGASAILPDKACDYISSISFNVYDYLDDLKAGATKIAFKDTKKTINNLKNVYDHIDVELTGNKRDIRLGNTNQACIEYFVTISASILEDFNNEYIDAISEYVDEDLELYIYVDKHNRIVSIKTAYTLPVSKVADDLPDSIPSQIADNLTDIDLELEVLFQGEKYASSDITASLLLSDSDNEEIALISGSYIYDDTTRDFYLEFSLNDNSLSASGKVESSLDSFTLDSDDIEININTEYLTGSFDLSASIGMSKIDEDMDELSGKDYILFEMTLDDIKKLLSEAEENFLPF